MLSVAAGHTSLGLLESLVQLYENKEVDFSKGRFVALDEWLGMSPLDSESCAAFLKRNFLDKVNYESENIRLFDGSSANHEEECHSVEAFIEEQSRCGVIDYLVLGAGMNGHLGLNEPGSSFRSRTRVVEVDETTKTVGQKYFKEKTDIKGGITLGIENFAQASCSVLMISGVHKQEILQKIFSGPITTEVPATAMHNFNNATVYCDRDAYGSKDIVNA
jgi:glucosamine-6-phosphate isomerase